MPRCQGIKRDGGRCAVVVGPGHTHCYSHDPTRENERRRNASRGGLSKARGGGELPALKKQLRDLAADVLGGNVDRGAAAVVNQILNTIIRAVEQERKNFETGELAERLEAMEEVLKGRKEGRVSKGNGLVRHYDKLSPEERFRLDVLEMARGDEQESENLEATAESLGLEPDAGRSAEIGAELLETWNAVRRRAA